MATMNPVLTLDRQDVEWLLQALGALKHENWVLRAEDYRRIRLLSPGGFVIVEQMQAIVRSDE